MNRIGIFVACVGVCYVDSAACFEDLVAKVRLSWQPHMDEDLTLWRDGRLLEVWRADGSILRVAKGALE
jgi:hypothetical protein